MLRSDLMIKGSQLWLQERIMTGFDRPMTGID